MRAEEFVGQHIPYADGYIAFSDHFDERLRERNISPRQVIEVLHNVETRRGEDLLSMPFIPFVIKTNGLDIAISKQKDKRNKIAYVVVTARNFLRTGSDEDVIYLEQKEPQ